MMSHSAMRKKRGLRSALSGVILGFVGGFLVNNFRLIPPIGIRSLKNHTSCGLRSSQDLTLQSYSAKDPMDIVHLPKEDTVNNSATNLVFVGVMTARKYLDTRAKAVFETWGSELPGKIAFFSSATSTAPNNCPDLPLVALPDVDDTYPPQKKSFLMLQYMWQNFGDKFEWFIRADDDLYVRTDRLEKLLRSVNSKLPRYIGRAGRGTSKEVELSFEYDENYCMGGPGVILSRETLKRVVPHIRYCLKNLYSTHEDVELGRCVQKYAGIPCTWNYEMEYILYHNYTGGNQSFTGNLKRKEIHRAITLHPVKSPPYMYRLHNYMLGLRIQELQHLEVQLHRDIQSMMVELNANRDTIQDYKLSKNFSQFPEKLAGDNFLRDNKVLGVPAGLRAFKPKKTSEIIPWDFLSYTSEYSLSDNNLRRRIHRDVEEGLGDITREVVTSINSDSRQKGDVFAERSILYSYRRVDAYGADTVLDLLVTYRKYGKRKVKLPVRRHVYVHQQFTGLEIREVVNGLEVEPKMDKYDETDKSFRSVLSNNFLNLNSELYYKLDPIQSKIIHFILPLSGRFETFQKFLKVYEKYCLVSGENTKLMIILFHSKIENNFNETINLVNKLKYKYRSAKIELITSNKTFSKAVALDTGVSKCKDDDLLFFIDVDIVFTNSVLHTIRLNTIINRQLYFPIIFSQFDPKIVYDNGKQPDSYNVINDFNGYWREAGFGMVSLYKKDYKFIGGFDLSIRGWGKEDVDLFKKAIRSNLTTFRAVDPHLIHVFHDIECDPSLASSQLIMCEGTRINTYAGTDQLANIIYGHPEYLRYAKTLRTKMTSPAAA